MKEEMKNHQNGQIVVVLVLVMLVALTIGLAITLRSVSDVTTSTQTEQSSRAFSAAEAGIERAIQAGPTGPQTTSFTLDNQSSAQVVLSANLPRTNQALEYPPV